jgi:hypothetical protein
MSFLSFVNKQELISYCDEIKKHCMPFLKTFKIPIYRGKEDDRMFFKAKTRKDRIPKDMPRYLHEYLDILFEKKFGWRVRSSGAFCTIDFAQSLSYGTPYMFFPIGDFQFIHSPQIRDLYVFLRDNGYVPFPDLLSSQLKDLFDIVKKYQKENAFEYLHETVNLLNQAGSTKIFLYMETKIENFMKEAPTTDIDDFEDFLYEYNDECKKNIKTYCIDTYITKVPLLHHHVEVIFNCEEYYMLNLKKFEIYQQEAQKLIDFLRKDI